jgi:hypothetical protein
MAAIDVWITRPRGTQATYYPENTYQTLRCSNISGLASDYTEGMILNSRDPEYTFEPIWAMMIFPGDDDPVLQVGSIVQCRILGCVRIKYTDAKVKTVMIVTPTNSVMSCASLMEDASDMTRLVQNRLCHAAIFASTSSSSSIVSYRIDSMANAIYTYVSCVDPGLD